MSKPSKRTQQNQSGSAGAIIKAGWAIAGAIGVSAGIQAAVAAYANGAVVRPIEERGKVDAARRALVREVAVKGHTFFGLADQRGLACQQAQTARAFRDRLKRAAGASTIKADELRQLEAESSRAGLECVAANGRVQAAQTEVKTMLRQNEVLLGSEAVVDVESVLAEIVTRTGTGTRLGDERLWDLAGYFQQALESGSFPHK